MIEPAYSLVSIKLSQARDLCARFHGYGSAVNSAVYAFGVEEASKIVAAYVWQPPPPGVTKAVCPEAPHGVLSLSRMVAVPKQERSLRHISKPLRRQMRLLIDRTRWPVLLTYSDEGQGHNGHVYTCSGWSKTSRTRRPFFLDSAGRRVSSYSNGKSGGRNITRGGTTTVQRWEHWICARGVAHEWMRDHGWLRVPIAGKRRSGNQAFTYIRKTT